MARKRLANDRDFLNGFLLGHVAGRIEAARELEAEFQDSIAATRADALRIINESRRLVGLPPAQENLDGARPLTMQ